MADSEKPRLVLTQVRETNTDRQERLADVIDKYAVVVDDPESAKYGAVDIDPLMEEIGRGNVDDVDKKQDRSYIWQIIGEKFTVLPETFDFDLMSNPKSREFYKNAFFEGFDQGFRKATEELDEEEDVPSVMGPWGGQQTQP